MGRLRSQKGACQSGAGRRKSQGTSGRRRHDNLLTHAFSSGHDWCVRVDVRSCPGLPGQHTAYYAEIYLSFVLYFRIIALLNLCEIMMVMVECTILDVHVAAVIHERYINQTEMFKINANKD